MASALLPSNKRISQHHLSILVLVVLASCADKSNPTNAAAASSESAGHLVTLHTNGHRQTDLILPALADATALSDYLPAGAWRRIEASSNSRTLDIVLDMFPGYTLRFYQGDDGRVTLGHFRAAEATPVQAVAGLSSLSLWTAAEKKAPEAILELRHGSRHERLTMHALEALPSHPWQRSGKKKNVKAWNLSDVLALVGAEEEPAAVAFFTNEGKREDKKLQDVTVLLKSSGAGAFHAKAVNGVGATVWRFRNLRRIEID